MNRIDSKFKELRKCGKKAFIAFISAGYPSLKMTEALLVEFERIGVDIVELGVPFTDPMADGAVIQEASKAALKKGVSLDKILRMVRRARASVDIPICLMTYFNPVFSFGQERFINAACASGVDGVIVPDLPQEEAQEFKASADKLGLHVISFVSPTTSIDRARNICRRARGFIYYVSLTGVTGQRRALAGELKKKVSALKRLTRNPVCVGFGVSTPSQVRQVQAFADGVIVGSAIVKKIGEGLGKKGALRRLGRFVSALKGDVRV